MRKNPQRAPVFESSRRDTTTARRAIHPVTDRISSASRQISPGPRPDFIVAAATAARFYRQTFSAASAASMSARYFFTLTSFTTQVKTFIAICKSSQVGKEGAMRMLLSWGSLP